MDAKDILNLQEAYIEIYDEDYKPWDFGPKQKAKEKFDQLASRKASEQQSGVSGGRGTATRANRIASVARDMRTTLDKDSAATGTNPARQGLQPSTQRHTSAAMRGAGGGQTARKAYQVKPLGRGGGSSASGVGSASGSRGSRGYQVGGSRGYGLSGIRLADEYDLYDIILSHLLDEGYAETIEDAEVMMVNMSEEWRESILEDYIDN